MRRPVTRSPKGWLTSYDERPVWKLQRLSRVILPGAVPLAINLKGCNGSGKSTIPFQMLAKDPDHVFITASVNDKKPVATFCPAYGTVILGTYLTACGGCDSLGSTQVVQDLLRVLWDKEVHILYEGVIVGDIKSTFYELMKSLNEEVRERQVEFCFMGTAYKDCLRRIKMRNGGKEINEALVRQKFVNSLKHAEYYASQGDVGVSVLKTSGTKDAVFARFLDLYQPLLPVF